MVFPICVQRNKAADLFFLWRGNRKGGNDDDVLLSINLCRIFCPASLVPALLWSCISWHSV